MLILVEARKTQDFVRKRQISAQPRRLRARIESCQAHIRNATCTLRCNEAPAKLRQGGDANLLLHFWLWPLRHLSRKHPCLRCSDSGPVMGYAWRYGDALARRMRADLCSETLSRRASAASRRQVMPRGRLPTMRIVVWQGTGSWVPRAWFSSWWCWAASPDSRGPGCPL